MEYGQNDVFVICTRVFSVVGTLFDIHQFVVFMLMIYTIYMHTAIHTELHQRERNAQTKQVKYNKIRRDMGIGICIYANRYDDDDVFFVSFIFALSLVHSQRCVSFLMFRWSLILFYSLVPFRWIVLLLSEFGGCTLAIAVLYFHCHDFFFLSRQFVSTPTTIFCFPIITGNQLPVIYRQQF